jgi:voltage-gated potassium channel
MAGGARIALAHYTQWLRRWGAAAIPGYLVLAIGLSAMTSLTEPDVQRSAGRWVELLLWCCLGYFAIEGLMRGRAALQAREPERRVFSPAIAIDLLAVVPVPIALACGVAAPTAWLFASAWILKLAQNSSGLQQIGRVFVLERKALTSVLALFLMVLFLSSAAMHMLERQSQPQTFGTLPGALWWSVVTLTTTGYGDEVPHTPLGRLLGAAVMISGIATFGLWIGILANGFTAESRRRNFIQTWDLVSKVPFLQSLDPPAITELTHMLRRVEVPERTAVIRQGRVGDCMYFVAEGEVEVEIAPAPVQLGPGAFFGEMALLGDSIRTANVSTTKPSTLLILDLADFHTVMAHHSELARVIDAEARRRASDNQRRRELQSQAGSPKAPLTP